MDEAEVMERGKLKVSESLLAFKCDGALRATQAYDSYSCDG
jgi:hypothetical protein